MVKNFSFCQALQSRSTTADSKSEKQLTTLLSIPLDTYNVVTVLSLKNYPNVMNLLATSVRKVSSTFLEVNEIEN